MGNKKEFNLFEIELSDSNDSSEQDEVVDLYSFSSGKKSESLKKGKGHSKESKFVKWWKNRKVWQKSFMISALAIILIVSIGFSALKFGWGYNYNPITDAPEDLGFQEQIDEKIVNIALFGLDTRNVNSFKGNTDSIMILSLNTRTKKVKIISVMRDTFTSMSLNGKTSYGKINSAYARGGPELAIKTLNQNFGLDISEYATVNFFGMVDIIEAVGGIEAELTKQEVTKNLNSKGINFCVQEICQNLKLNPKDYYIYESGKQHLNGVQAVAYSRIRYVSNIWGTSNDYGRTDRQRYVMQQLFNKAVTLDKAQYMKLAKSLIPCSETSLSYNEIISLAVNILLDSPSFEQTCMPQPEFLMKSPSGYGSVVYYDFDFAKELIHAFIYDDIAPEKFIEDNGIEKNDWFAKTGPKREPSKAPAPSDKDDDDNEKDTSSVTSSGSDDKDKDKDKDEDKDSEKDESKTSSGSSTDKDTEKPDDDKTSSDDKEPQEPEDGDDNKNEGTESEPDGGDDNKNEGTDSKPDDSNKEDETNPLTPPTQDGDNTPPAE